MLTLNQTKRMKAVKRELKKLDLEFDRYYFRSFIRNGRRSLKEIIKAFVECKEDAAN